MLSMQVFKYDAAINSITVQHKIFILINYDGSYAKLVHGTTTIL
jgi:hypothetical protein